MLLRARHHHITLPRRPLIMGIVNLSEDSFCGDGTLDPERALAHARQHLADGADLIDVGAESARTNRPPISTAEEIARFTPFVTEFARIAEEANIAASANVKTPLLSINTWRPEVARAILPLGGDLLNDMSGLPTPENAEICATHGAALLIMHTLAAPKIAQTSAAYPDILETLVTFFADRVACARAAGLSDAQIVLDPGIDFAKQRDDNLTIYRNLERITALGFPVLVPVSRKTVIGDVLHLPDPCDRDAGTVASTVAAALRGAAILRVHNVRATHQTLQTLASLPRQ